MQTVLFLLLFAIGRSDALSCWMCEIWTYPNGTSITWALTYDETGRARNYYNETVTTCRTEACPTTHSICHLIKAVTVVLSDELRMCEQLSLTPCESYCSTWTKGPCICCDTDNCNYVSTTTVAMTTSNGVSESSNVGNLQTVLLTLLVVSVILKYK